MQQTMNSRSFFVVGEKFSGFANGKEVLTIDQLRALTRLPYRILGAHNVLNLGQGVNEDDLLAILRSIKASPELDSCFNVTDLHRVDDRAAAQVSHKHVRHNCVIGVPQRTSSDTFHLPLNLDERCDLMGDHQTGQHIQGMVLVEAFRQSFLAVTETFFPFGQGAAYFVINSIHMEFQSFLFPLPAHVDYRILEADVSARRARYKTTMSAMQNGTQCASAAISFTVYSANTIAQKEAELAEFTTEMMLAARRRAPNTNSFTAPAEVAEAPSVVEA